MPSWQWRNNRIIQAQRDLYILYVILYPMLHLVCNKWKCWSALNVRIKLMVIHCRALNSFFFLFIKFMLYSNKNLIIKIDTPTPTSAHIYCNEQRGTTRDWENQPNSTSSIHFQNEWQSQTFDYVHIHVFGIPAFSSSLRLIFFNICNLAYYKSARISVNRNVGLLDCFK